MYPCHVSRTAATYRTYPRIPRIPATYPVLPPRIPPRIPLRRSCQAAQAARDGEEISPLLACRAALPAVAGSCAARRHRRERRPEMGRVRKGGVVRVGNQFERYFNLLICSHLASISFLIVISRFTHKCASNFRCFTPLVPTCCCSQSVKMRYTVSNMVCNWCVICL